MHRKLLAFVLPLLMVTAGLSLALALPSCAHTGSAVANNAVNYATSEQLYITTLRTVTSLASQGKLTLAQAERFDTARRSANSLLDQWRAAVLAGQPASFQSSFDTLIAELVRIQLESQEATR